MAARTGAFSFVPVRLTHLDGLSLNMFLTHFCFRQLSPLIRDLNNTCYPFLTTTGGFDRYSGLSGLKFGPVQRWVTSKNFRIFSNILDFSVFRVPKCQKCRLEQICLASAFSDFFLLRLHRIFLTFLFHFRISKKIWHFTRNRLRRLAAAFSQIQNGEMGRSVDNLTRI